MPNERFEPIGVAKRGKTLRLTGTGPGLARHESAGRFLAVSGTEPTRFCGPNPDPLPTLMT